MYQSNVSLLIKNYNILSTGSCQYIGFTIYDQAVCFFVNLLFFVSFLSSPKTPLHLLCLFNRKYKLESKIVPCIELFCMN